jgi:hypothetical protein
MTSSRARTGTRRREPGRALDHALLAGAVLEVGGDLGAEGAAAVGAGEEGGVGEALDRRALLPVVEVHAQAAGGRVIGERESQVLEIEQLLESHPVDHAFPAF